MAPERTRHPLDGVAAASDLGGTDGGQPMKLSIPDMTCGHCKATVERTIIDLDSTADVVVDLGAHTVQVETKTPADMVLKALAAEGYPATPLP